MEQSTRFIGMDVHKDTIAVAVTATGDSGAATPYGTCPNPPRRWRDWSNAYGKRAAAP